MKNHVGIVCQKALDSGSFCFKDNPTLSEMCHFGAALDSYPCYPMMEPLGVNYFPERRFTQVNLQ